MYVCMYVHMKPLDLRTIHYIVVPMAPYIYIDRRHLDRVDVVSLRMEGVFWFGFRERGRGVF